MHEALEDAATEVVTVDGSSVASDCGKAHAVPADTGITIQVSIVQSVHIAHILANSYNAVAHIRSAFGLF
jgi:hypothetical protein